MYHRRTLLKLLRFDMFRFKPILVYHSSRLVYFIKLEALLLSFISHLKKHQSITHYNVKNVTQIILIIGSIPNVRSEPQPNFLMKICY